MKENAEEMLREYISQAEQAEEACEREAYDDTNAECCCYLGCLACMNM